MIIASVDLTGQGIHGRTWINTDHQTMAFDGDTARFKNQGREELFHYNVVGDRLDLTGTPDRVLSFRIESSDDSLTLREWVEPSTSDLKASKNGDAVMLRQSLKLKDYQALRFANASSLTKAYDDFESIRFRSDACMGTCPVLDITITKKREVTFKADAYARHLGEYSAELDKSQMRQICELVRQGDLIGLKSRLKTPLDFPTYTLTIDYGSEVSSYSGYSFYAPLNELVKQFLDFDTTLKLKKLE